MENAADALQMAAFVLIFVLALSISINAFGEARQTAQLIVDNQDREYDYTYIQGSDTRRMVSGETIIPSIYKAYKENYKIVFKNKDGSKIELYKKDSKPVSNIDLEKEVLGNEKQKEDFIEILFYGYSNEDEIKVFKDTGLSDLLRKGNLNTLYHKIKDKKYEERLGVYYQEELQEESNTPNANKTEKRVITYIQQ